MKKLGDNMLVDDAESRIFSEPWHKVVFWLFVVIFFLGGALSFYVARGKELKRHYVAEFLQSLDDNAVVYVDGQSLGRCDDIIVKLQTLHKRRPHHSSPVEGYQVEVEDGEKKLKLVLGNDSHIENEYWVYLVDEFPVGREFPSDNDIIGSIDNMVMPEGLNNQH